MMPRRCAADSAPAISMADRQRLLDRERPLLDPVRERLAVEMLHDDEHRAGVLADVMQRADVGMRQARNRLRLALEAGSAIGISGEVIGKDFDRDRAIEAGVAGFVNLAHAPGANEAEDLVPDPAACP